MNSKTYTITLIAGLAMLSASEAVAQNSSLYRQDIPVAGPMPLRLQDSSFFYQELPPPPEIKLHDIVTVIVDEKAQVTSEGELERRKNANFNASLGDWLELDGLSLKPAPQSDGDLKISAALNNQYRTESELESRDSMRFRISAEVVDIRPNGNLVLEARRQIRNNEETWEYSLTGIVRRYDVLPNNTVLSEKLAELSIHKRERGSIFDGYRRGWALRLYDRLQPF